MEKHASTSVIAEETIGPSAVMEEPITEDVLSRMHEMSPRGIMTDCFRHCIEFFEKCTCEPVDFNELITHWIMEGYFGPTNDIEEAYEEGHSVLMGLVHLHILKTQENKVSLNRANWNFGGFVGTASMGLIRVLHDGRWKGLGPMIPNHGMIKTPSDYEKWQEVSTLLIDGNYFPEEVLEKSFQSLEGLQILSLFNPKMKSLSASFSHVKKLFVLVLRGCCNLNNINSISELRALTVLEISGASSLEIIPPKLFEVLTSLQSLNLSGSQIRNLPPTLSKLTNLRWLILRQCHSLKNLPKLYTLANLEKLDLFEATSFTSFEDKSFAMLSKLQFLDLSQTQIGCLPIMRNLNELTHLLLRGCKRISRTPNLNQLPGLQILDLSSSCYVGEINGDAANHEHLTILNLSGTQINHLPCNFNNLSKLYLRNCRKLKEFPETETNSLKILDLSDSLNLVKINDKYFRHLNLLTSINLSRTGLTYLPSFSHLSNLSSLVLSGLCLEEVPNVEGLVKLKELDLSDCRCLVKLPSLHNLLNLEVLDLSGCIALKTIHEASFEKMSVLKSLKLSNTMIERIPRLSSSCLCYIELRHCVSSLCPPHLGSLSKLEVLDLCGASSLINAGIKFLENATSLRTLNLARTAVQDCSSLSTLTELRELSLKGCKHLKEFPNLEGLIKLEVLDLSETSVSSVSYIEKLSRLRGLFLKDCLMLEELPSLKTLPHLNVLILSGSGIKVPQDKISELSHIKHRMLGSLGTSVEVNRVGG